MSFAEAFQSLTGFSPMRWQTRLFRDHFTNGELPSAVSIPTGLGKTAVMAIWLIALAEQMKSGAKPNLPRRLVYVVDRRAVVDQATRFAEDLRANLGKSEASELAAALGLGEREALPISTLRGQFVDNREWLTDPAKPAIIVGTVDMIGSRLLFEGYGVSRKMRPYHAGLLGADTLVLLDEAHLVPPFEAQLAEMTENAGRYGPQDEELGGLLPKFQLLPLSATGRRQTTQPFVLEERDFRNPDDAAVLMRLFAKKRLMLHDGGDKKLEDALAERAWAMAQKTQDQSDGDNVRTTFKPVRVIVYCNSRDVAEKTKAALDKKAKKTASEGRTEIFVGARRVKERTDAEQRLKELGFLADSGEQTAPAFLVATSAGEVGIDLDADHMVCDLVAWERMVQRFGRVNRRGGEWRHADMVVIDEGEPKPKKQEAPTADEQTRIRIYQGVKQLLEKLRGTDDTAISVSPESLRQLNERAGKDDTLRQLIHDASSSAPLRPALNRALVDAWSMTSLPEHTGRPEVAPWLRGWVDELPQTTVTWRKHLPVRAKPQVTKKEIEDFFEAAPIHTSETLETETFRVMSWLKTRAGKFDAQATDHVCGVLLTADGKHVQTLHVRDLLGDSKSDKKRHEDIERGLPGKILVMSAFFGGLKDGLLSPDEKNGWLSPDTEKMQLSETADSDTSWMDADAATPVIRFRIIDRDAEPDGDSDDTWHESLRFDLERNADGEATHWLSIQKWRDTSNTGNDRAEGRPQALTEHQCWAAKRSESIGKRLGLPDDYITMLATAARLHDEGKRAGNWQRAFRAERDAKKFKIDGPLAKTRGPINQAVLGGYRHEFGSLPYANSDTEFKKLSKELQDLALHLIVAHHGYARPLIATDGCEDAPPSMLEERAREVALRFARLQKRWGPWGLAWWEALLRAADAQASRDNDNRERN